MQCHEDVWDDLAGDLHLGALSESEGPHDPASCIACHSGHQTGFQCTECHEDVFDAIKESVHGPLLGEPNTKETARVCITCHGSAHGILATSDRQSPLHPYNVPRTCGACHFEQKDVANLTTAQILQEPLMDDTHGAALLHAGLVGAPTCVSCHGMHGILAVDDPNASVHPDHVSESCGSCHVLIMERYKASVHGQTERGHDREPATCTDCHEPHGISRPDTSFKLHIIETCSGCHGEQGRSYRGTYHGRITEIGFGGVASCDECHTAHEIQPSIDERSSLNLENGSRVATCAKCHKGATPEFARYLVHVDPTRLDDVPTVIETPDDQAMATWLPILYWVRRIMRTLIFVTWAIWGLHTLLWFFRAFKDRKKIRAHLKPVSGRWYRRWPWSYRAIHLTLIASFLLLALTGIPLRFHEAGWSKVIFAVLGGPVSVRNLHRLGAVLTFAYAIAFVVMIAVRVFKGERGIFRGPNSLFPRVKDAQDMIANTKYFLKGGPTPAFDRWTYYEKFDFVAEVWGVLVIGFTGLVMWFPILFTKFLPGPALNLAHIVHSYEALLATSFIFSMHFFNANLRPGKFPVDPMFLTGRISEEELRHERPAEYERMRLDGRLETEALPPPRPRAIRRAYRIGVLLMSVGILLLVLMLYAMFRYGVG